MPDASTTENAIQTTTILSAIIVTVFALWSEYFSRYVLEQAKKRADQKEGFDVQQVVPTARTVGFLAFCAQCLVFLGGAETRQQHPVLSILLFLTAVLVQSRIQYALEARFMKSNTATSEQSPSATKPLFWMIALAFSYLFIVYFFSLLFFLFAKATGASDSVDGLSVVLGVATGILAGMTASFAMAPIYLRRMLPVKKLDNEDYVTLLDTCFARAKVKAPSYWVIRNQGFGPANAMIAGMQTGKGLLRPGLFISESLFTSLDKNEFEAVILHEVSHSALDHVRRRLVYSMVVVFGCAAISAIALAIAYYLTPHDLFDALKLAVTVAAFIIPFVAIKDYAKQQETQADIHAVFRLGADIGALENALMKIDAMNFRMPADSSETPRFTHPETLRRVALLRERHKAENEQDQSQRKAA